MAAPLRRTARGRRRDARAERHPLHDRRGRAGGVLGPSAGPPARVLGARDDGRAAELQRRPGHARQRPGRDPDPEARPALALPQGPPRGGPRRPGGASSTGDDLRAAAPGAPAHERQGQGHGARGGGHPLPPDARRLRQGGQRRTPGGGGAGADDRLRQRRQHAARPWRVPPPRAGAARRDWREPRAAGAPVAQREPSARCDRRRARGAARELGRQDPDRPADGRAAAARPLRLPAGWDRARVRDRRVDRDDRALRPRARVERVQARPRAGLEGRCDRRGLAAAPRHAA